MQDQVVLPTELVSVRSIMFAHWPKDGISTAP